MLRTILIMQISAVMVRRQLLVFFLCVTLSCITSLQIMILNHESLFPEDKEEEDQEDLDLENIDPEELKVRIFRSIRFKLHVQSTFLNFTTLVW